MPQLPRDVRPKPRATELRTGTDGWMSTLMSRLPLSATQAAEADAQRYLDALADALEGGRILGGEAQILARLAGSPGWTSRRSLPCTAGSSSSSGRPRSRTPS